MKAVEPIVNGQYLRAATQQAAFAAAAGLPVAAAEPAVAEPAAIPANTNTNASA
jgi:NAD(P)H-quinone oxidoreductase subunit K